MKCNCIYLELYVCVSVDNTEECKPPPRLVGNRGDPNNYYTLPRVCPRLRLSVNKYSEIIHLVGLELGVYLMFR